MKCDGFHRPRRCLLIGNNHMRVTWTTPARIFWLILLGVRVALFPSQPKETDSK